MLRLTGDYLRAVQAMQEALAIYRDLGDRDGEAEALNEAGTLHRVRGDLSAAGSCHRKALDLAREIGLSWDEAHALAGLGRCGLAAGRTADPAPGPSRRTINAIAQPRHQTGKVRCRAPTGTRFPCQSYGNFGPIKMNW